MTADFYLFFLRSIEEAIHFQPYRDVILNEWLSLQLCQTGWCSISRGPSSISRSGKTRWGKTNKQTNEQTNKRTGGRADLMKPQTIPSSSRWTLSAHGRPKPFNHGCRCCCRRRPIAYMSTSGCLLQIELPLNDEFKNKTKITTSSNFIQTNPAWLEQQV